MFQRWQRSFANCHQVLVLCDNQYNSHFWPSVEFGSCFSLRHHSGLSEIPVFHTFRPVFLCGRLQVCLVAFSIACAVAGARYGGSEEGTPIILHAIFLIILLVLQIWKCFQFCERLFFFQLHALEHLGQLNTLPPDL